ncbi:MAG TPA: helix-turn-helix transcriptional regulator [Bacteroidia bacterium]|nr:helix-turn-helix transcriptional regulator [Bacteroidia bacterium]
MESSDENKKKKRKEITEAGRQKVSRRIKVLLKHYDMTPTELAQACDKPKEYITRLKNGKIDPRTSTLNHIIEEGFEITEKDFYDYDNLPEKPKKKYSSK